MSRRTRGGLPGLAPYLGNLLGREHLHQRLVGHVSVLREHAELLPQLSRQPECDGPGRPLDVRIELELNPFVVQAISPTLSCVSQ